MRQSIHQKKNHMHYDEDETVEKGAKRIAH